jgi:hypothetical protein
MPVDTSRRNVTGSAWDEFISDAEVAILESKEGVGKLNNSIFFFNK